MATLRVIAARSDIILTVAAGLVIALAVAARGSIALTVAPGLVIALPVAGTMDIILRIPVGLVIALCVAVPAARAVAWPGRRVLARAPPRRSAVHAARS